MAADGKMGVFGKAYEQMATAASAMQMTGGAQMRDLAPHLPSELVGGSIPDVPGREDEAVWNAAAQACGTERVHFCYTVSEGRCWYLATPSSALASSPDSWCPLAAALPGNSEFWDKQTVYLYEQEGAAGAIRWDSDTGKMQVYLGASRTILPKIQSMEANFVTISAESATQVPWFSRALNQERLSRLTVKVLLYSGIGVTLLAFLFWMGGYAMTNIVQPRLDEAKEVTRNATNELMDRATNALQSNSYKHVARIQELLDTLMGFGGTLVKYEVTSSGSVIWEALVPRALEGNLSQLQGTAVGLEPDGRLRIKGTQ